VNQTAPPTTVLGESCVIRGELSLEFDAIIHGHFEGILRVGGLLQLMPESHVTGTVVAGSVRIAGPCEANVVARHGIAMLPGAILAGSIYTSRLSVVEGAAFDGELHIGEDAMKAAEAMLEQIDEFGRLPQTAAGNSMAFEHEAAPQPHRFPVEAISQSPNSVVSNLIHQRRAKLMNATNVYTRAIDQAAVQQQAG